MCFEQLAEAADSVQHVFTEVGFLDFFKNAFHRCPYSEVQES